MTSADQRERERLAAVAQNRADEAPVVEELRKAGFDVDGIADLFNKNLDYRAAIPILLSWLPRMGNSDVKQAIVRALSVKWAAQVGPLLVAEFERAEDPTGTGLRWTIGNALEALADDDLFDDLVRLATDRSYGGAREMVVLGLGKIKNPRSVKVLIDLLSDEEVAGHAVMALGKLRAMAARPHIERFLNHPKPWIRKEAKKALANIDKSKARKP